METQPSRFVPVGGQLGWWLLLGFDGLLALVVVGFFLLGLVDGSVSSFNILLWLGILAVPAGVIGGAIVLQRSGQTGVSLLLLGLMAVPGLLAILFLALVLLTNPRWN